MSSLPIAANMPSAAFTPLVVIVVVYALLSILAGRARGHDDSAQADRFSTWAFALVLLSAVYVAVLLIATIFSYPSRVWDMVIILVVIGVFFALLLYVLLVLAELLPRALRRGRGS
jgi:hypothetical protein